MGKSGSEILIYVALFSKILLSSAHENHDHGDHHHESDDAEDSVGSPSNYDVPFSELDMTTPFQHTHRTSLDPDGVMMLGWTPDLDKQEVTFTIEAQTLGWIGFGISSNGAMDGADIVTAWVKDNRLYVQDRHGEGHNSPPIDDHGDWVAVAASENDTHTVVTLRRAVNTCDHQDFPLTNETTRFIYAWGEVDPSGRSPPYHGRYRGAKFALALLPFHKPAPTSENYETWRVSLETALPNDKKTFYWCHIEKIPPMDKKHQYIGFSMEYGQNAREFLHHSVSFECAGSHSGQTAAEVYEKYVGQPGYECYTPGMPDDFNFCETFFINWVVGSEGELLPTNVGVPLGERHGGADYILFQTHYDNPHLKQDVSVAWAMDIYYTDELRPNEAGIFGIGHAINFGLTIPPRVPAWVTAGHCSEHCTRDALPPSGVKVFMVFLHAHYLARAIRVRHFRDGEELPILTQDSHFAADFQQSRKLSEEVLILPGDHLTVECDYDSTDRKDATFSGWEAKDEMCQAFINYYPRSDLALCRSTPTVPTMRTALQMPQIPGDVDLSEFIFCMELLDGKHYQASVKAIDWTQRDIRHANEIMAQGEHFIKCLTHGRVKMELPYNTTTYPAGSSPFTRVAPLVGQCHGMPEKDFYAVQSHHHHDHDHHHEESDNQEGHVHHHEESDNQEGHVHHHEESGNQEGHVHHHEESDNPDDQDHDHHHEGGGHDHGDDGHHHQDGGDMPVPFDDEDFWLLDQEDEFRHDSHVESGAPVLGAMRFVLYSCIFSLVFMAY